MGRRYRDEVGKMKDNITYHVIDTRGKKIAEYKDKKEALGHRDRLQAGSIRKTRTQTKLDKE